MPASEYAKLDELASLLPRPNLEGYQARSQHLQGIFDPQGRGQYLATRMIWKSGDVSLKVSARLTQELFAGRITQEQFQFFAFGKNENLFESHLKKGLTFRSARLEPADIDEDDHYLVFELGPDPAARQLEKPSRSELGE